MEKNSKKIMDLDDLIKEMKSYEKKIMRFKRDDGIDFIPANNTNPSKPGTYVTLRCGLGGIYQMLNEWKGSEWSTKVADASFTIAYSREPVVLKTLEKMEKKKSSEKSAEGRGDGC